MDGRRRKTVHAARRPEERPKDASHSSTFTECTAAMLTLPSFAGPTSARSVTRTVRMRFSVGTGPTTHHVVPNRGFSDRDAELEQLAVDARGAPGRVGAAHLADEFLNGARDAGPPGPTRPTLPAPVEPKASSMPAEDRVGLDDDERVPPTGPQVTEPRPEHPVDWPQPRSPSSLSLQDRQLMAQRGVLDLKRRLAPQARPERGEQHETHGSHGPGGYQADARSPMYRPRTRFPVGTGSFWRSRGNRRPWRLNGPSRYVTMWP